MSSEIDGESSKAMFDSFCESCVAEQRGTKPEAHKPGLITTHHAPLQPSLEHHTATMTSKGHAMNVLAHNWTPEEIMQDFHGKLKGVVLVRCMEWYTNDEVQAKVSLGRDTPIDNANMLAEHKRNLANIALESGHLPTVFKLQFDKRRLINLTVRLGEEHVTVTMLRMAINRKDSLQVPTLSATPTLQELEAARPENGRYHSGKARETRDYWNKFLDAAGRHSSLSIQRAYGMGETRVREEISRARQIVSRMQEVEDLKRKGQSVPQTYTPPATLLPGQQIYTLPPSAMDVVTAAKEAKKRKWQASRNPQTSRSRIVILKLPPQTGQQRQAVRLPSFQGNGATAATTPTKGKRAASSNPQTPRSRIVTLKLPLQTQQQNETPTLPSSRFNGAALSNPQTPRSRIVTLKFGNGATAATTPKKGERAASSSLQTPRSRIVTLKFGNGVTAATTPRKGKRAASSNPRTPCSRIVTLKLPRQTEQQNKTPTREIPALSSSHFNGATPLKDPKEKKRPASSNPQTPRSRIVTLRLTPQTPKQPQTPATTKPRHRLLSLRTNRTLRNLRLQLLLDPRSLPPLSSLAEDFSNDHIPPTSPAEFSGETPHAIDSYLIWCAADEPALLARYGTARIGKNVAEIVRFWLEEVALAEEGGEKELGEGETFLGVLGRALGDLEGFEALVEEGREGVDEWARRVQDSREGVMREVSE